MTLLLRYLFTAITAADTLGTESAAAPRSGRRALAHRTLASLLATALLSASCGDPDPAPVHPPPAGTEPVAVLSSAPIGPAATLVLERPVLGLGDVVTAELVVIAASGARVLPYDAKEIAGLWLLDREEQVSEVGPGRWQHRTQFRVRAREVGQHEWPASQVVIEGRDGEMEHVEVPSVAFEVVSTLAAYPARDRPFGLLAAEPRQSGGSTAIGFAAGVATTCALFGIVALLRRPSGRPPAEPVAPELTATPTHPDLASFVEAEAREIRSDAERSPLEAAHRAARMLRLIIEQRYGVEAHAMTREELAAIRVPLAARLSWPELMRISKGLDELRFRPANAGRDELEQSLLDIEAFVKRRGPRR